MPGRSRFTRILVRCVAPVVGLAAIGVAVFLYLHDPAPRTYGVRITAGSELGMRHQLALRLQKDTADRNITFDLRPCAGSEEALDWVNSRKVDVALVQGALSPV